MALNVQTSVVGEKLVWKPCVAFCLLFRCRSENLHLVLCCSANSLKFSRRQLLHHATEKMHKFERNLAGLFPSSKLMIMWELGGFFLNISHSFISFQYSGDYKQKG